MDKRMITAIALTRLAPEAVNFFIDDTGKIEKWHDAAKKPTQTALNAEIKKIILEEKISAVKQETARRIEAAAPAWRQANALADITKLQVKEVLTQEEAMTLAKANDCLDQVKELRMISDHIESRIKNGENLDPLNDDLWVVSA